MCINTCLSKPGADQLNSELHLLQHSVQVAAIVWGFLHLAAHRQVQVCPTNFEFHENMELFELRNTALNQINYCLKFEFS